MEVAMRGIATMRKYTGEHDSGCCSALHSVVAVAA